MIESYAVRQAAPTDLLEIADLDDEAFSPYGTAESPAVFAARLAAFPEGFIVAEVEGAIAGYGCSEKWRQDRDPILNEDSTQTHCSDGYIFCITGMAVRQTQRGKGLGLVILDYSISLARHHRCACIVLETTHAQGLYTKRGFRVMRERVQDGIQLSVMQLELTE